jgi:hypothetical protein
MRVVFGRLVLSILASFATTGQSATPEAKPVISLTISAKPTIKVGSTVGIHVVLANISTHDIVVQREVRGTDCFVDVRDENGKLPPDTKFGLIYNGHVSITDMSQINPNDLNGASVYIPVKAGKTWEWDLDAAHFYDMSKTGKYLVFIRKFDPENSPLLWVRSNTIAVTVVP